MVAAEGGTTEAQVIALCELPRERRRHFFSAECEEGVWLIPEPEVDAWLSRKAEDRALTLAQVANRLGLSYWEASRRTKRGEIARFFLGGRPRVLESVVEAILAKGKEQAR